MRGRTAAMAAAVTAGLLAGSPAGARPTCLGKPATIVGTDRHDVLEGTNGPDVIVGLDGADVIRGFGGNDRICGGSGEEYGDDLPEALYAGAGDDRVSGGDFYEEIYGGPGRDILRTDADSGAADGGPGNDTLIGGPQSDFLGGIFIEYSPLADYDEPGGVGADDGAQAPGEPGIDTFQGRGGGDFLFLGPGSEVMNGGPGEDQASFYTRRAVDYSADLVTGIAEGEDRDVLKSIEELAAFTSGDVTLRGDDGPNVLAGSPGSDAQGVFYGGGGDDELVPWRGHGGEGWMGPIDMYGEEGSDETHTSFAVCRDETGPNVVDGGPGDDELNPWCGDVTAGEGDDLVMAWGDYSRERTVDGGPGTDVLAWPWSGLYSHLEADLAAGTAREVWDDGTTSQFTRLVNVEGVQGTQEAGDVILGDDGPNLLLGAVPSRGQSEVDGGDRIDGRGGNDTIYGDEGDDVIVGGDGFDDVDGAHGHDSCSQAEVFVNCESFSPDERRWLRLL